MSGPSAAAPPRSREQRRVDTERRLAEDVDVWVATASADGAPHLVPLSHHWDGETLLLATSRRSPTGRNLAAGVRARIAVGLVRDVTMIDGEVEELPIDAVPASRADAFAAHAGFDARRAGPHYRWYLVRPTSVQAWREEDELAERELMRDGSWLEG